MRNILNFHIHSYGWNDIGYNFCIGEDGNVYEGRGWERQAENSGSLQGYNENSLSICFMGKFDSLLPTFVSFLAVQELINCGIDKGFLSSHYSLIAHRQISTKDYNCPGNALYNEIKRNLKYKSNPKPITL